MLGMQRMPQQDLELQPELEMYPNSAAAVGGPSASLGMGGLPQPNIPMSDSYNSSATSPVFPPAAQDKAAAVFGSNNERQGSTSGFREKAKEKLINDINLL